MNKPQEHVRQDLEQGQEGQGKPFKAIDPPGMEPQKDETPKQQTGQARADVLGLLAKARTKQRHEKPLEDPFEAFLQLFDFLDDQERRDVMDGITLVSLNAEEAGASAAIATGARAGEAEEASGSEEEPLLQVDKAAGEFRFVVKWLLARPLAEKITAMLYSALINGDIERAIAGRHLYEGNVGDDLDRDWQEEITAVMETPEGRQTTPPELLAIAAYALGLEAANY